MTLEPSYRFKGNSPWTQLGPRLLNLPEDCGTDWLAGGGIGQSLPLEYVPCFLVHWLGKPDSDPKLFPRALAGGQVG